MRILTFFTILTLASGFASAQAQESKDTVQAAVQRMNTEIGKIVSPNGVDQARYVVLGGARQWITVRGQDRNQPILIYLHGGPGGALADFAYMFQRPWEDYFTVVNWDQRGFGRSDVDGDKLQGTITLEKYMADLAELIEKLKTEFGQPKVFVLGQSWGTVMALEIARRHPESLYAIGSIGQMVDERENFEETRRLFEADARKRGDTVMLKAMQDAGPMPDPRKDYEAYLAWIGVVQGPLEPLGYSWHNSTDPDGWGGRVAAGRQVSPSAAIPHEAPAHEFPGGFIATQQEIIQSTATWSAYGNVGTRLKVPYVVFAGSYDWQTPITLARKYYAAVCAPYKAFIEFKNSAHVVHLEEPGRFTVALAEELLPAAAGKVPAGGERCAQPKPASK